MLPVIRDPSPFLIAPRANAPAGSCPARRLAMAPAPSGTGPIDPPCCVAFVPVGVFARVCGIAATIIHAHPVPQSGERADGASRILLLLLLLSRCMHTPAGPGNIRVPDRTPTERARPETPRPAHMTDDPDERDRDLTMLLAIARNLAATLELQPLLDLILDEVRGAVDYHGAGVLIVENDALVQLAQRGPFLDPGAVGRRLALDGAPFLSRTLDRGLPLVIDDVWADDPSSRDYRQAVSEEWLRDRPYIRSWVGACRSTFVGVRSASWSSPTATPLTSHRVTSGSWRGGRAGIGGDRERPAGRGAADRRIGGAPASRPRPARCSDADALLGQSRSSCAPARWSRRRSAICSATSLTPSPGSPGCRSS